MPKNYTTPQSTGLDMDWGTVLDQHGVQYLALDLDKDDDLFQLFRSDPRWAIHFEDDEGVLLARTDGETDPSPADRDDLGAAHRVPRMHLANNGARAKSAGR
jgi:hypothetical protein